MASLFLLRHGQTTANAQEIIQGPRIDAALSDVGQRQANALGLALSSHPLAWVLSSPLKRARQTAAAVALHHGLEPAIRPELHEMDYGDFTGQSYAACRSGMDAVLACWKNGDLHVPYPGGESAAQADERVRPIVAWLLDAASTQDVAVVAHGRLNKVLLGALTGIGAARQDEFPQSNACINELEVVAGRASLKRVNDIRHLPVTTNSFS